MSIKNTDWLELDTAKSDYRAQYGKYHHGTTLLDTGTGTVIATGICTCSSRESAMLVAERNRGTQDKDRFITRAKLISWAR